MDFLTIKKLLAQDYFAVPDYQRDYEWTNIQNNTLLDDVFHILESTDKTNHFLGAVVTIPYEESSATNKTIDFDEYSIDEYSIKHVVDGQQRLTSFSVLLQTVYDVMIEDMTLDSVFKDNYGDRIRRIIKGDAYNDNGMAAPRLILNGNTGNCYNNEIIHLKDDDFNKRYRGAKRILAAQKLFRKEITTRRDKLVHEGVFIDNKNFYKKLIEDLTNKIVFVEIECDASSDAFQVFDSLNGKGLDLTAADRIKNIMMSWSPSGKGSQKWDSLVQEIGEEYLVSFFVSLFFYKEKKRISKNRLPEVFKEAYKNSALADFDYFYRDLKNYGMIYGMLRMNKTQNTKLDAVLKDFQSLRLDQVYVILFSVAVYFGKDVFNNPEYIKFAKTVQALVVRMQVCEKSMNKLDTIFIEGINLITNKSASLSVLCSFIDEKKKNISPDEQFEKDFIKFAPKDVKISEYYIRNLEEYRRKQEGNRSEVGENMTVEHIIPQTLEELSDWYGDEPIEDEIREDFHDTVVENIGNKVLLYGDDNSSASNNDYVKKKNVYINGKANQTQGTPISTFQLVKDLINDYPNKFLHEEVFDRADKLAKFAVDIW